MKKVLLILLIVIILLGGGFSYLYFNPQLPLSQKLLSMVEIKTTTGEVTQIVNPASVFCKQNSGTLEIITDLSGGQSGLCHLPDGNICEEWAYFKGKCPTAVSGIDGSKDDSNIFIYQPLGLSMKIPIGRSAKESTSNPCADKDCSITGIRITTDKKDDQGYDVYIFLRIDKLDETFRHAENYRKDIDNIDTPTNTNEIIVNQSEKKVIKLEGVSGYGSFVLKELDTYYLIEIFDFTSDQPIPYTDDFWAPTITNSEDIINSTIDIIKTISI